MITLFDFMIIAAIGVPACAGLTWLLQPPPPGDSMPIDVEQLADALAAVDTSVTWSQLSEARRDSYRAMAAKAIDWCADRAAA